MLYIFLHECGNVLNWHLNFRCSEKSSKPFGWSLASMFFFKKVREALGLDRCHFPMTGAAPTNEDTLSYFMSVDIPLHEIYGMSETSGGCMRFSQ